MGTRSALGLGASVQSVIQPKSDRELLTGTRDAYTAARNASK